MQEQTHAPTHRAVITSSTAAAAITTLPPGVLAVAAPIHPDARLLQLARDLDDADAVFHAALDELEMVEDEILANGGGFDLCTPQQAERRAKAEAREDETSEAHEAVLTQIVETPAVTMDGAKVKAAIIRKAGQTVVDRDIAFSLAMDVLALEACRA